MIEIKKGAPSLNETPNHANDSKKRFHKDTKNSLTPAMRKVLNILQSGEKVSVLQLSKRLNLADPRSTLRNLRNVNYQISDFWVKSEFSKHKIYFIHQGIATTQINGRKRKDEKE